MSFIYQYSYKEIRCYRSTSTYKETRFLSLAYTLLSDRKIKVDKNDGFNIKLSFIVFLKFSA